MFDPLTAAGESDPPRTPEEARNLLRLISARAQGLADDQVTPAIRRWLATLTQFKDLRDPDVDPLDLYSQLAALSSDEFDLVVAPALADAWELGYRTVGTDPVDPTIGEVPFDEYVSTVRERVVGASEGGDALATRWPIGDELVGAWRDVVTKQRDLGWNKKRTVRELDRAFAFEGSTDREVQRAALDDWTKDTDDALEREWRQLDDAGRAQLADLVRGDIARAKGTDPDDEPTPSVSARDMTRNRWEQLQARGLVDDPNGELATIFGERDRAARALAENESVSSGRPFTVDGEGRAQVRGKVRWLDSDGVEHTTLAENVPDDARVVRVVQHGWEARAERIARTEAAAAYAAANDQAAHDLAELFPEDVIHRQWLAVIDARTRHDHVIADGQCRPLGEPFNVGGATLDRPRDPNGPAAQTVNCRCDLLTSIGPCDTAEFDAELLDADDGAVAAELERRGINPSEVARFDPNGADGTPQEPVEPVDELSDMLGEPDTPYATRVPETHPGLLAELVETTSKAEEDVRGEDRVGPSYRGGIALDRLTEHHLDAIPDGAILDVPGPLFVRVGEGAVQLGPDARIARRGHRLYAYDELARQSMTNRFAFTSDGETIESEAELLDYMDESYARASPGGSPWVTNVAFTADPPPNQRTGSRTMASADRHGSHVFWNRTGHAAGGFGVGELRETAIHETAHSMQIGANRLAKAAAAAARKRRPDDELQDLAVVAVQQAMATALNRRYLRDADGNERSIFDVEDKAAFDKLARRIVDEEGFTSDVIVAADTRDEHNSMMALRARARLAAIAQASDGVIDLGPNDKIVLADADTNAEFIDTFDRQIRTHVLDETSSPDIEYQNKLGELYSREAVFNGTEVFELGEGWARANRGDRRRTVAWPDDHTTAIETSSLNPPDIRGLVPQGVSGYGATKLVEDFAESWRFAVIDAYNNGIGKSAAAPNSRIRFVDMWPERAKFFIDWHDTLDIPLDPKVRAALTLERDLGDILTVED